MIGCSHAWLVFVAFGTYGRAMFKTVPPYYLIERIAETADALKLFRTAFKGTPSSTSSLISTSTPTEIDITIREHRLQSCRKRTIAEFDTKHVTKMNGLNARLENLRRDIEIDVQLLAALPSDARDEAIGTVRLKQQRLVELDQAMGGEIEKYNADRGAYIRKLDENPDICLLDKQPKRVYAEHGLSSPYPSFSTYEPERYFRW